MHTRVAPNAAITGSPRLLRIGLSRAAPRAPLSRNRRTPSLAPQITLPSRRRRPAARTPPPIAPNRAGVALPSPQRISPIHAARPESPSPPLIYAWALASAPPDHLRSESPGLSPSQSPPPPIGGTETSVHPCLASVTDSAVWALCSRVLLHTSQHPAAALAPVASAHSSGYSPPPPLPPPSGLTSRRLAVSRQPVSFSDVLRHYIRCPICFLFHVCYGYIDANFAVDMGLSSPLLARYTSQWNVQ